MDDEALDQLRIMLVREKRYGRQDYLGCFDPDNSTTNSNDSNKEDDDDDDDDETPACWFGEQHRFKLCEWAIQVVNYYNLPLFSVEVAMNLLDRFLAQHVPASDRNMECLHLLTLTSLYLALKLTTQRRPPPGIFVRLARAQFTVEQMEMTELQLLSGLDYLVHPPTAEEYVHTMLDAVLTPVYPAHILQHVEQATLSIVRKTLGDYMWVHYPPSVVALGALSWSLQQWCHAYDAQMIVKHNHKQNNNHHPSIWSSYPSPLTEVHRLGIHVDARQVLQVMEYLYHRTNTTNINTNMPSPPVVQMRKRERQTASPVSCMATTHTQDAESGTSTASGTAAVAVDTHVIHEEE